MTPDERGARGPVWVIAELDARGEIDGHAAMCLRHAIDGAAGRSTRRILVDLRDLNAIDRAGLELFAEGHASCRARAVELSLLLSSRARHAAIAQAFVDAGLGEQLRFTGAGQPPSYDGRPRAAASINGSVRGGTCRVSTM